MVRAGAVMDDWVHPIPSIEGPGTFGLRAEMPMTVLPTAPQLAAGVWAERVKDLAALPAPGSGWVYGFCPSACVGAVPPFERRAGSELCNLPTGRGRT